MSRPARRTAVLSDRDRQVLRFAAEMFSLRLDTLRVILRWLGPEEWRGNPRRPRGEVAVSPRTARQVAARWQQAGWVQLVDQRPAGSWVLPTPLGMRLSGAPRWHPYLPAMLAHVHAATLVRLAMLVERPTWVWTSQRELEGRWYREQRQAKASPGWHVPDGLLTDPATGEAFAVEVELHLKRAEVLAGILDHPIGEAAEIVYFAPPELEADLRARVGEVTAGRRRGGLRWPPVQVRPLPQVAGLPYDRPLRERDRP